MAPWRCTKRGARSSARPPSFSGAKSTSFRNILDYLPERQRPWVRAIVRRAYQATDVKTATRLLTLAKRLEDEYPSAAGSVREGLDETRLHRPSSSAFTHTTPSRIATTRDDRDGRRLTDTRRFAPTRVHLRRNRRSRSPESVFNFSGIRTNPGDRKEYVRRNGPYKLGMVAGIEDKLPFGNIPRLLLAVRGESPTSHRESSGSTLRRTPARRDEGVRSRTVSGTSAAWSTPAKNSGSKCRPC